jgi:PPM family protein phosphatase
MMISSRTAITTFVDLVLQTPACTFGMDLLIAHVGDSRAYLFRGGELQPIARDQTMAQFLADTGQIHPDEIARRPLRNSLTSVLGTQVGQMEVDLRGLRLADGDQLMLCSDGLTEMVAEAVIADVLGTATASASEACEQLVNLALDGGGKDNVTVIVGRYRAVSDA